MDNGHMYRTPKEENRLEKCQEVHMEGWLEYEKWKRDAWSKPTLGDILYLGMPGCGSIDK
jgi:hypothetical protein